MTNRLLQRKQMVSFLMLCHHLCSLFCQAKMFTKCFNVFIGCWCPPSWQGHSPKDWNQGEACQDVQNHPRCCICLWLQDSVRRWQDNRLCYGLRLFRLCQEEWAQTQTCQGECGTFFSVPLRKLKNKTTFWCSSCPTFNIWVIDAPLFIVQQNNNAILCLHAVS